MPKKGEKESIEKKVSHMNMLMYGKYDFQIFLHFLSKLIKHSWIRIKFKKSKK